MKTDYQNRITPERIESLNDNQVFVFGYEVLDEDEDVVESCYGYYDYEGADEAMAEGIAIIDYIVDKAEREEAEEAARIQHYEMICEPFWID